VTDEVWTQASDEAEAADNRAAEEVQRAEEARKTEEALQAEEAGVGEAWAAGNARVAEAQAAGATGEAPEAERTVDVVFSLPAETQAERVALCGEFNDWSLDSISLARGADRAWSVTVPLSPGTYRYKFLLDGETWENGPDADRLEDNAYGTQDSVIVVTE
jgi:Glycogen recognition site of AMP-activated protein kinase